MAYVYFFSTLIIIITIIIIYRSVGFENSNNDDVATPLTAPYNTKVVEAVVEQATSSSDALLPGSLYN